MGMSVDLKLKVKESFDYENDGSLKAIARKASVLNAPILIIGLGGTGVDAVLKVKRMIYDRIQCFTPGSRWKDKPDNIEYLVMDTDISNMHRSIQGIGFNEALEEVFIFTNPKMSVILDNKERFLTKETRAWVSDKMKMDQVIDGAGANRQIGRLMMFLNINQMVNAIESKIKRVAMQCSNDKPIYVFILSGICGGTGSGTFLDIPYIIKGIVDKPEIGRIVHNIGLLYLPDVNLAKPGISEPKKLSLKRNGFAALKELDYLMNLENSGEKFEQLYGNLPVSTLAKPYDVCVLMSTKDKSGKSELNPYDNAITVSAETVVNFVASEEVKNDFTINSFLSNVRDDNMTFLHNILGKNRRPVNYCYSIAGASSASLPVDELISYITYLAFKEVDTMYSRQPSEQDVKEVIRWFGLEDNNVEMRFLMDMPRRENLQRHSYEKIKMNTAVVLADFDDTLARQKAFIDRRCEELAVELQNKIVDNNNILMNIFRDVNRGPVYANQILFTLSDNISVTRFLLEQRDRFINNKPSGIQLNALKNASTHAADRIFDKGIFASKKKLRDEFINSFSEYYDTQMKEYLYHKLSVLSGIYHDKFLSMNNSVYDSVADLMNTLVPLFKKYGSIKTEAKETKSSNLTIMSWSLIEAPEFIKELELHLKEGDSLYIDMKQFIASFYSKLYENADVWSGKEKVDGIELINRFISESFTSALDKSMDYYLELFASKDGKALDKYCFEVLNRLNEKAKIMFPIQQAMKGLGITFPRFSYIVVPQNTKVFKEVADTYADQRSPVKHSSITQRVSFFNFESGVPLYAYDSLSDCEDVYARNVDITPGLHLYEANAVSSKDWSKLPSPYAQSEWMQGHYIPKEAEFCDRYRKVFDLAKEYGYIVWEDTGYCCYWGETVNYQSILEKYNVKPDGDFNHVKDVKQVTDELQNLMNLKEYRTRLTGVRRLYDNLMMDDSNEPDDDYARNIFIRMVEVRENVEKMVKNHEECLTIVNKLNRFGSMDTYITDYIIVNYTGLLQKRFSGYVYLNKDGSVQPLCALEGTQNDYPEYHIFNYYMKLDPKVMEELKNRAKKTKSSVTSQEDYEQLKNVLISQIDRLKEAVERLKENWHEIEAGSVIKDMYMTMLTKAESELKGFTL